MDCGAGVEMAAWKSPELTTSHEYNSTAAYGTVPSENNLKIS